MTPIEIEYAKYELAKLSFQECLEYLDLLERGRNAPEVSGFAFERALSKSFAITYARSFTNNKHGVGRISGRWLRNLGGEHRELHDTLVGDGRNALVAHIDLEKLKPNIFINASGVNNYVFDWHVVMINENNIDKLRELVKCAHQYCIDHQKGIRTRIRGAHIKPIA
ncbi:hypothetical protein ACR80S_01130 [Halomonas sp. MA07-2]|uniref:hypothetical protein n=1 Tax=Halomonas sp. MA07-2 TaxID=3440841 RepID=UPI003EF00093